MKKSDIFLVIFIAMAGVVIAYFVCGALMEEIRPVSFKTVGLVDASLAEPDPEVFNSAALNPTVETFVGSCVDSDQNGELDLAESVLCQEKAPGEVTEDDENAEPEEDAQEEQAADELQGLLEQITNGFGEKGESEDGGAE